MANFVNAITILCLVNTILGLMTILMYGLALIPNSDPLPTNKHLSIDPAKYGKLATCKFIDRWKLLI